MQIHLSADLLSVVTKSFPSPECGEGRVTQTTLSVSTVSYVAFSSKQSLNPSGVYEDKRFQSPPLSRVVYVQGKPSACYNNFHFYYINTKFAL